VEVGELSLPTSEEGGGGEEKRRESVVMTKTWKF
jgi:hypothetical protein